LSNYGNNEEDIRIGIQEESGAKNIQGAQCHLGVYIDTGLYLTLKNEVFDYIY
jgi:hypothetical protein